MKKFIYLCIHGNGGCGNRASLQPYYCLYCHIRRFLKSFLVRENFEKYLFIFVSMAMGAVEIGRCCSPTVAPISISMRLDQFFSCARKFCFFKIQFNCAIAKSIPHNPLEKIIHVARFREYFNSLTVRQEGERKHLQT